MATRSEVAILVPVLRRPHRIAPLMESVALATAVRYRLLFIASPSDREELRRLTSSGADVLVMDNNYEGRGDYARKCNAGYLATTEPLLFLGADDLHFHPGWFEAAVAKLTDGIGVVGTNDLGSPRVVAGDHSTHSLVTRAYADAFGTIDERGKILHEGYPHEWVDDELVATAKHRGAWAFAADSHVEHLHPTYGKAAFDGLYRGQGRRMRRGRPLFAERSALWT